MSAETTILNARAEMALRRIAALGPEGDRASGVAAEIMGSLMRRGLVEGRRGGRVRVTGEGLDALRAANEANIAIAEQLSARCRELFGKAPGPRAVELLACLLVADADARLLLDLWVAKGRASGGMTPAR